MLSPTYTLTHRMLNSIVKIEKLKLQIDQSFEKTQNKFLLEEKRVNDLFHMAHILGINMSYREVENITKNKKPIINEVEGKLILNLNSALNFVDTSLKGNYLTWDINFVVQINKLLLSNFRANTESKIRESGEAVDKSNDTWSELRDLTVTSTYIRPKLVQTLDTYKASISKTHDLINLIVLWYSLIRICPFVSQNKLTILTILEIASMISKYFEFPYISFIKNIDNNEEMYLEKIFEASKSEDDLTSLIEVFLEKITEDFESTVNELNRKNKISTEKKDQPFLNLNQRQLKILRYLQNIPTVRREEYCEMMQVSTMTAFRDLDELVNKNLLRVDGKSRGTKYLLSSR